MARWTPDPSFYPSPRLAAEAPPETLGYVALLEPTQQGRPDALGVVDLDPASDGYGTIVSTLEQVADRGRRPTEPDAVRSLRTDAVLGDDRDHGGASMGNRGLPSRSSSSNGSTAADARLDVRR